MKNSPHYLLLLSLHNELQLSSDEFECPMKINDTQRIITPTAQSIVLVCFQTALNILLFLHKQLQVHGWCVA